MNKYVSLLILLMIILTELKASVYKIEQPEYLMHVHEITHQFKNEMKKTFNLVSYCSGGSMPHDIEEIDVDFIAYSKATIDEARILEIKATERLVEFINSNENIRPYLREYPFPSRRVHILISFRKENQNHQTDDSISLVCRGKNGIVYNTINPETELFNINFEEPYEEALKIVQGSK